MSLIRPPNGHGTWRGYAIAEALTGTTALRRLVTLASMADNAGVELRLPYSDLDLVRWWAALPAECAVRDRTGKAALRAVIARHAPVVVDTLRGVGYGPIIWKGLAAHRQGLRRDLLKGECVRRGWLATSEVGRYFDRLPDRPDFNELRPLVRWIAVERHLRRW